MLVKITELMRIKSEFEKKSRSLKDNVISHETVFGCTYEDDVLISGSIEKDEKSFYFKVNQVRKILIILESLCEILDNFNSMHNVNSLIRQKQNIDYEKNVYETIAFPRSTPKEDKKIVTSQTGERKVVKIEFHPYLVKKDIKNKIKDLKIMSREIQQKIEDINSKEIEIPYDYSELDEILFD